MQFFPLTGKRWPDFERLFGSRGACAGCWCMWWRLTRREFENQQGDGNREAMRAIVESGQVPGILGYADGEPVAWCSVAPRDEYASLNRSRILKRIDESPVWSLVCLFIAKSQRGKGATAEVIAAAVDHARSNGGTIVEAYPSIAKSKNVSPFTSFMGLPGMYKKAGFTEVAQPSAAKRVMRFYCS